MDGSAQRRVTAFQGDPGVANVLFSASGAREYGYQTALISGPDAFGWATPAILEAVGDRWLDHGWAEVIFRRPTYPGEDLLIAVEPAGDATWTLHIAGPDTHDRIAGTLGTGDAPWLAELADPVRVAAEEAPATLPRLTLEDAPIDHDLRPLGTDVSVEEMRAYAREQQQTDDERFMGDRPRLHPGWIAIRPVHFLHHSFDYGPALQVRSHIQFAAPAYAGQVLVTAGRIREVYQRKEHHYAVVDCVTRGESDRVLIRQRHTTIFEVARHGGSR